MVLLYLVQVLARGGSTTVGTFGRQVNPKRAEDDGELGGRAQHKNHRCCFRR
jgi:hypothetical protein